MLFSVTIPVYNRQSLVGRTLESVFAQGFTDFEVIAVDDGSTDGSLDVLRSCEPRIRIFSQKNKGAGATRNVAAAHARGQYLAFLDSDDLWFPWALAAVARAIQECSSPSFLSGQYVDFADEASVASIQPSELHLTTHLTFLDSWAEQFSWCPSTNFVRADVFRTLGGFSEVQFNCED